MISLLRIAAPLCLIAAVPLASCNQAQPTLTSGKSEIARSAHSTSEARQCMLVAAEAFEALTEHAGTAPIDSLATETGSTTDHAHACASHLSASQASELEAIIQRLGEFRSNHDRTRLALSAVEGYRVIVSAQIRNATDIPLEVALLDYAGFRYQAGVRSATPLWSDARQAVDFADGQWRTLSARVSDETLRASLNADIRAMRTAVDATDVAGAQQAASLELERVDALEQYFAQRPAGQP